MEWNGALEWNRIKLEDGTSGIEWGTEHDNLICTYLSKGSSSSCEEHKVL